MSNSFDQFLSNPTKETFARVRSHRWIFKLNCHRAFFFCQMSHSKDPEKTSDDAVRSQVFENKTTEKDSMLAGVRLPFLHGFFPRVSGGGHPSLHLTQLAHPSALPPHLNSLPGHHPMAEHHFQGFSAFRKFSRCSLLSQITKLIARSVIEYSKLIEFNLIKNLWHLYVI